jgi:mRNA interferase RelE/StbE
VSYRTDLTPPAKAEIRALPGTLRSQALKLIAALAEEPRPPRARELRGKPNIFRIWLAGRWRIVYEIDEENRRLLVLRVRSKDQIDYESLTPRTRKG